MDIQKRYSAVNALINGLELEEIFQGFSKYAFALYNSEEVCLEGKLIPYQDSFIGNTAIFYEGRFIAIWNIEMDPVEDDELLAYSLVHEMFHCHQKSSGETRYPSDLKLIAYPEDTDNFQKKHCENLLLAESYKERDIEKFKKFHALRRERLARYPEMVREELKVETAEGAAEYVGLKALRKLNTGKFKAAIDAHLEKLSLVDALLFDVRRISYFTGAVYFLALELFRDFSAFDLTSSLTVYEENAPRFESAQLPDITPSEEIESALKEMIKKKRDTVSEHLKNSCFTPYSAFICGYDPMNMFRVDDIIYCSHFVFLNKDGKCDMIRSKIALKLKPDSDKEIVGYYI